MGVELDPIIRKLLTLSKEDLETVESINEDKSIPQMLVKCQEYYLSKGFLTAKQVRFIGNVLKRTFKDEFNINGTYHHVA